MAIKLSDTVCTEGEPHTSGELRTVDYYGYGCYEVSMKPVAQSGVVSSLYTFAGPSDQCTDCNGKHNEIDIEFLGYDTTQFQANYWTNDDAYVNGHPTLIKLDFDASEEYHKYGFKWTSTYIEWYVDGNLVHRVADVDGPHSTPKVEDTYHKIMFNVWPVDDNTAGWAGRFTYPGKAMLGGYQNFRFEEGDSCTFGQGGGGPGPLPPIGMLIAFIMLLCMLIWYRRETVMIYLGNAGAYSKNTILRIVSPRGSEGGRGVTERKHLAPGCPTRTVDENGTAKLYSGRTNANSGTFIFAATDIQNVTYGSVASTEGSDSVTENSDSVTENSDSITENSDSVSMEP